MILAKAFGEKDTELISIEGIPQEKVPFLIASVHMYNKLHSVLWTFTVAFTNLFTAHQSDYRLTGYSVVSILLRYSMPACLRT